MSRKPVFSRFVSAAAASAVCLVFCADVSAQALKTGDVVPSYALEGSILFGDGRVDLRDFYGSVVLIDWWAFHCPACVGSSLPRAVRAQAEFGADGFASILVETEGLPREALFGFMTTKFPTSRCLVVGVQSLEVDPPRGGVPHAALIGVDGTVLWHGMPNAQPKKVEELTSAELKKLRNGWGDSAETRKARALAFGKGRLAEAAKALDAADAFAKDAKKVEIGVVRAELEARFAVRSRMIRASIDEGRISEAKAAANALAKDVKGVKTWETGIDEILDELKSPELQKEAKADQALVKLLDSFGAKGPNPSSAAAFRALAEEHDGTKTAGRAAALAEAVVFDPSRY